MKLAISLQTNSMLSVWVLHLICKVLQHICTYICPSFPARSFSSRISTCLYSEGSRLRIQPNLFTWLPDPSCMGPCQSFYIVSLLHMTWYRVLSPNTLNTAWMNKWLWGGEQLSPTSNSLAFLPHLGFLKMERLLPILFRNIYI